MLNPPSNLKSTKLLKHLISENVPQVHIKVTILHIIIAATY